MVTVLLEYLFTEKSSRKESFDRSRASSFTVVTGAVDDPRMLETPTHTKVSHAVAAAAEYEPGRAKAFGALCRIFSAQPCANPFLPIYLARFCHAATVGLEFNEQVSVTNYVCCGPKFLS